MSSISTLPAKPQAYLSRRAIADLFGISTASVDRLVKAGTIPPAKRLGERMLRWRREDIEQSLNNLK